MSNQQHSQQPQFQPAAPKKDHRVRNVIGGVAVGLVTLIFIIGFFADDPATTEAADKPLPNTVTTTEKPAAAKTTVPATTKPTAPKPIPAPKPKPLTNLERLNLAVGSADTSRTRRSRATARARVGMSG
jgi:type IV secretory pathway VirB10-like protein